MDKMTLAKKLDALTAPGTLYEKLDDNALRCFACGHRCLIREGKRGICQVRFNTGGELRVPGTGLKLRGGYRVVPSPFFDADKQYDKKYISAGFGYDMDKSTTLNFTYIRGSWIRDSSDSLTPGGTEENIQTNRMLAGVTFRF